LAHLFVARTEGGARRPSVASKTASACRPPMCRSHSMSNFPLFLPSSRPPSLPPSLPPSSPLQGWAQTKNSATQSHAPGHAFLLPSNHRRRTARPEVRRGGEREGRREREERGKEGEGGGKGRGNEWARTHRGNVQRHSRMVP
jgi:hypothetical protein